jgi:hypothetical protein
MLHAGTPAFLQACCLLWALLRTVTASLGWFALSSAWRHVFAPARYFAFLSPPFSHIALFVASCATRSLAFRSPINARV